MTSSDNKAIVKDMRLASLDVLRKTAHDVFEEKTLGSNLCGIGITNATDNSSDDQTEDRDMNGFSSSPRSGNGNGRSIDSMFVMRIDEEDLVLGRVVGRGAFCVATECTNNSLGVDTQQTFERGGCRMKSMRKMVSGERTSPISSNGSASSFGYSNGRNRPTKRKSLKNTNIRERYVMKHLSPELKRMDKINFLKGTVDLAMETRFLASLDHANIVSLKGISTKDAFSDGYFILLEKLNDTLSKRVKRWMDMDRQCKGITGVFTGSKKKAHKLQTERIIAAQELVRGMDYLHENNIVFRDMKPDNIGFDCDGVLKIFDFGLAKELRDDERTEDGLYKMTGCTGAIRYMSPENLNGSPYNHKTDVYSWAMIMWNILALEPPFALYTEQMIIDRVCKRGYRPKIFSTWSPSMRRIMNQSWSADINERPEFSEILVVLDDEFEAINKMCRPKK